jgi:hypothetical protein
MCQRAERVRPLRRGMTRHHCTITIRRGQLMRGDGRMHRLEKRWGARVYKSVQLPA